MSAITPAGQSHFFGEPEGVSPRTSPDPFRPGADAARLANHLLQCPAWELNPVRRIKSPLCQPLHPQGNCHVAHAARVRATV
ncbi:MAG: hypothetical protein FD138_517 [Planctomycetota bacterium]|nr:MAG: hypothetical protein FD138_517 [Planctomycetota bacterium]